MKVRALTGFIAERGVAVNPGDVFEMEDRRARIKIADGSVAAVEREPEEPPAPLDTRDVEPEHRDPKTTIRDPRRISRRGSR